MRLQFALFTLGLMGSGAAASTFYTLDTGGVVFRSGDAGPRTYALPMSQCDGLDIDTQGDLYAINWSGNFGRINSVTGVTTMLPSVPRPNMSGFYKDLAWDPANQQLLGVHLGLGQGGQELRLVAINRAGGSMQDLGVITGIVNPQTMHRGSLAVSNDGTRYLQVRNELYRLDGMQAELMPFTLGPPGYEYNGLGVNHATSEPLYFSNSIGFRSVTLDGTISNISAAMFADIAISPTPGTLLLAGLGAACAARRRRTTGE